MNRINIKPLSVNKAWKGRRCKTKEYKNFERDLLFILPKNIDIPKGKLSLFLEYGFSSRASDIDNPNKMIIDILSKKYGFNDNRIYYLVSEKFIVKKGMEYFKFNFIEHPTEW